MRRLLVLLGTLTVLTLVACSKQTVGQACNPAFGITDGDCESPLLCTKVTEALSYCCPAVSNADTPKQCRAVQSAADSGTPIPFDGGADAAVSDANASDGSSQRDAADAASDASDASDANDSGT